jgi:hypothetical protein
MQPLSPRDRIAETAKGQLRTLGVFHRRRRPIVITHGTAGLINQKAT